MPNVTPGIWQNYFQGPLLTGGASVTIFLVPGGGHTVYLRSLHFSTFSPLAAGTGLYLAVDQTVVTELTADQTAQNLTFPQPLAIANSMIAGVFGIPLTAAVSLLVAYVGDST